MKLFALATFVLLIGLTSCEKWGKGKGKKECNVYYSEDFKEKDVEILGLHTSDIEILWVEYSNKYDGYTLIAKSKDGELYKEHGACVFDVDSKITFKPNAGDVYNGSWLDYKEKYNIPIEEGKRTEEITFVYKEQCWKK
jgi:hypothetical protein